MKQVMVLVLVLSMFSLSLSACANIKNDGTRTKTEGTLIGTGAGAAAGAGVGALVAGRKGALVGALVGALAGAIGGYAYGTHVANKKADYANEEAWLDACIKSAAENNQALRERNQKIVAEIGALERQTGQLQKDYAAKTANKSALLAEKKAIDERIAQNKEWIAAAEAEITEQNKVVAEAKTSGKSEYATVLQQEIVSLQQQKAQLEDSNRKLTSMSSRLSV